MQPSSAADEQPSFRAERDVRGTSQIITVRGELDVATAQELTSVTDRAIGLLPDRVVIDLSATTFLDTAGVDCLVRAHRHAQARQVDLVVIPAPGAVERILNLCGADLELKLGASRRPTSPTDAPEQRKVAAAHRTAAAMGREAEHYKDLSHTILNADRELRRRLKLDPPHNAKRVG